MQVQRRESSIAEILQSLLPLLGDVTGKGLGGLAGGPVGAGIGGAIGRSSGEFARNSMQQQQGQEPMMFGQSQGIQQPEQQMPGRSPLHSLMSGLSNVDMFSQVDQSPPVKPEEKQTLEDLLKKMSALRKEQEDLQASGATPQELQSNADKKQFSFKEAYDAMTQEGKDILMGLLKNSASATLAGGQ